MGEVTDLAGQHEVIAENLQSDVIKEITCLVKDLKEERKKVRYLLAPFYEHSEAYYDRRQTIL